MPINRVKQTNNTGTWIAAAKAAGATHIWALNETSGTTATDQGSSPSNGTYVGSPVLNVPMGRQTGVLLNGTNQYVTLPGVELPSAAPWTIEAYGAFGTNLTSSLGYLFSTDAAHILNSFSSSSVYSVPQARSVSTSAITTRFGSFAFTNLKGIAVDSAGNVYATDATVWRVFNSAGVNILNTTTAGGSNLLGIGVEPGGGNIYTTDGSNTAIKKWNSAGTAGTNLVISGGATISVGLYVDSSNNVFCTTDTNIQKFTGGTGAASLTIATGVMGFGVCTDASGNIYAALASNGIKKYASTGGAATLSIAGTFFSVAVDAVGNIYGSDNATTVKKYSPTGTLLQTLMTPSSGTYGLFIDANFIYTSGSSGERIDLFPFTQTTSVNAASSTQPQHYAVTYDGTNLVLYVNSVAVSSIAPSTTLVSTGSPNAAIGTSANSLGTNCWSGSAANIAVYSTKLTPAQISNNYNSLI